MIFAQALAMVVNRPLILVERVEEQDRLLAVGSRHRGDCLARIRLVERHEPQFDPAPPPPPAAPVPGVVVEQERRFPHAGIGQDDQEALGARAAQDAIHGGEQWHAGGNNAAEVFQTGRVDALAVRLDVIAGIPSDVVVAIGFAAQFEQRTAVPPLEDHWHELP